MLTNPQIRAAKPQEKPYKLFDEKGLYLLISRTGERLWRLKYRFGRVEKLLALGTYPDTTLKGARDKRDEARKLLDKRVDPSAQRKAEKTAQADSFEAVAREWLAKQHYLAVATLKRDRDRLENYVIPYVGNRPVRELEAPELLAVLRRIESRGTHETAHRTRAVVGRVLRYAIATGRASRDVAADLKGALTPVAARNFAALTDPKRVGELLRAIDGYVGQPTTHAALRLLPLVFVRPGELRRARWSEFDLETATWRIPAERMKSREPHIVPLSTQAIDILRQLAPITGPDGYLFPSLTSKTRPISENTINAALRRLGYSTQDEMTGHGFRAMASTLLNEQAFPPDVIELQLAHAERDEVRGAYNRAQRMPERRQMMQAWADYLGGLKTGASVVAIRRSA